MKYLFYTFITIVLVGGAFFMGKRMQSERVKTVHNADLVLENIRKVWKLSTVEATVSEIYQFGDTYAYNISPFTKSMLVRVKAHLLAGFDLDSLQIDVNESGRSVRISRFPEAEILSVDHDLTYYDIKEGTFNSFSPADFTKIQQAAKDSIKNDQALLSQVLLQAEKGKTDMLDLLSLAVQGLGYTLVVEDSMSVPLD